MRRKLAKSLRCRRRKVREMRRDFLRQVGISGETRHKWPGSNVR